MRYLGKTEGKTKRDRIRNQKIRMGLQIMPFKEMTELAPMGLFGHIVGMGVRDIPKLPGKLEYGILKGEAIEWNREEL